MSSKDPRLPLRQILQAVKDIESDAEAMDFEAFRSDPKTVRAVERSLQIISEAAIRLGDKAQSLCPGVPWNEIRGIGNWLRHQYDKVDLQTVWHTASVDVPRLKASVETALGLLQEPEGPAP